MAAHRLHFSGLCEFCRQVFTDEMRGVECVGYAIGYKLPPGGSDAVPVANDQADGSVNPLVRSLLGPEILVTPKMAAAGVDADAHQGDQAITEECAERIYRAMAALAPVPLVTDGELAALRERDEAVRKADSLKHQVEKWKGDFLSARDVLNENERQLAARDARIAELDSLLAARPTPVPDTPKPAPNVFRDFGGDRRRVGG